MRAIAQCTPLSRTYAAGRRKSKPNSGERCSAERWAGAR
ncbi:hypothetical protein C7S16_5783 [Burkholderia thailandensis]|uniref:DUF1534 domain-containing protein n=1 Tax=Burkholderia thailandensis TaxID=57975 RepID=A0AAW9CXC2_BURTH|nr:hypothetical protein [Burkholderia thailandensis]